MIDLQQFAGDLRGTREYLAKPFSKGEFTYSTNGHIMVRVPRIADVAEITTELKLDEPLKSNATAQFVALNGLTIPPAPEENEECPTCEGEGMEHTECSCCQHQCPHCRGTGKEPSKETGEIAGVPFQMKYLRMMLALPGVEISKPVPYTSEPDTWTPMQFRFDGGIGALMPMRETYAVNHKFEIAFPESGAQS